MRIGTVYPDREAYRDPSIQPFFLSGLKNFMAFPKKIGISQYSFCPNYISFLNIVASPSCTEYHWGSLIALYVKNQPQDLFQQAVHHEVHPILKRGKRMHSKLCSGFEDVAGEGHLPRQLETTMAKTSLFQKEYPGFNYHGFFTPL